MNNFEDFKQEHWTTKEKNEIKIKDLTINHLGNIVNMLKRKFNSTPSPLDCYPCGLQGDMAQYSVEEAWDNDVDRYFELKEKIALFEQYYKFKQNENN
jgi:hypothetical protein